MFGNPDQLKYAQERISSASGMEFVIVDYRGHPLLSGGNYPRYCRRVREDGESCAECERSDAIGLVLSCIERKPYIYICPCGLLKAAIAVEGQDALLGGVTGGVADCPDVPREIPCFSRMEKGDQAGIWVEDPENLRSRIVNCPYSHFESIVELVGIIVGDYFDGKADLIRPYGEREFLYSGRREYNLRKYDCSGIVKQLEDIIEARDYHRVYSDPAQIAAQIMEMAQGRRDVISSILQDVEKEVGQEFAGGADREKEEAGESGQDREYTGKVLAVQMRLSSLLDYVYKYRFIHRYQSARPVFDYIDGHIKEYFNMQSIIANCHISQQYLLRIFKEQMKMSALDYIQNRKMMIAKWYICFTEYSTTDVAVMLGYADSGYFSKVFKKFEHITPHQYKLRVRTGK